jgi:hypothetical protein
MTVQRGALVETDEQMFAVCVTGRHRGTDKVRASDAGMTKMAGRDPRADA